MPDDGVPPVYVEELTPGPPRITGVDTTTTAFIGPTRAGPVTGVPTLLTSQRAFEQVYGDGQPLAFGDAGSVTNFMWHAARAFFEQGGRRLYVMRVHAPGAGADGNRPDSAAYASRVDDAGPHGFAALEALEDIALVAAPGATFGARGAWRSEAQAITEQLVAHAEQMRYRLAILDSGDGQSAAEVRAWRSAFDTSRAALYYPWIRVADPVTQTDIVLPPSAFAAGICVRTDIERGVFKAPANELVRLATGFERAISKTEQDTLNPDGINVFRTFAGRGHMLWGARTLSRDPAWKYVPVRRCMMYLEHSIERGLQWAVFEPNGAPLWSAVRRLVEDFLSNEWRAGALQGSRPQDAYFVRCDASTMSQQDLATGRLVVLVGVALLKPSEFVLFRVAQATADASG
jgi:phage tail sheath protein FI